MVGKDYKEFFLPHPLNLPLLTRCHRRGGNTLEEGLTPLLDTPLTIVYTRGGRNFKRGLRPLIIVFTAK